VSSAPCPGNGQAGQGPDDRPPHRLTPEPGAPADERPHGARATRRPAAGGWLAHGAWPAATCAAGVGAVQVGEGTDGGVRRGAQGRQVRPRQGLGLQGAWWLGRACCGGREVQTRRQVGGCAGVTPTPSPSGARARAPGMTQAGNRQGRWRAPAVAWRGGREHPDRARRGWCRERVGGGGQRGWRSGRVAVARQCLMALWRFLARGGRPEGGRPPRGRSGVAVRSPAAVLGLVQAARSTAGPCQEAVGEMGAPAPGLPALVARRREKRVTGVDAGTERRAWETMGPNAIGSRQRARGQGTQRLTSIAGREKQPQEGLTTAAT